MYDKWNDRYLGNFKLVAINLSTMCIPLMKLLVLIAVQLVNQYKYPQRTNKSIEENVIMS